MKVNEIFLKKAFMHINLTYFLDFMLEFIKEQALRKAQESKNKISSSIFKSGLRPYSSTPYYSGTNRPISGISVRSKVTGVSEIKMFIIFIMNFFKIMNFSIFI